MSYHELPVLFKKLRDFVNTDEINQKQFLNIVAILSFDLFGFIKPTTYQDHLQIRYKMGFWRTCHVTPQTFTVTSYIFPHCLHYLIMLSDSNEVVYFPR